MFIANRAREGVKGGEKAGPRAALRAQKKGELPARIWASPSTLGPEGRKARVQRRPLGLSLVLKPKPLPQGSAKKQERQGGGKAARGTPRSKPRPGADPG